jgi:hypothetical protein
MQSEAKRSLGRISLQLTICRVIFRNCREGRSYCLSSFLMVSRGWKEFSRPEEQGEIFGYCREEQRGIANGGRVARAGKQGLNAGPRFAEITPGRLGVGARASRAERRAQIRRDHAGLGICNQQIVTAAEERG